MNFFAQFWDFEISKLFTYFKPGLSVYLYGVVAWSLDILIGKGAADQRIKILSGHVTTLAWQRRNQMSQSIGLRKSYIRSSLVSILPDLWDRYKYTLCILFSLSWCENNPSLRKVVMYKSLRGRSQTTLTRFWLFFDHLSPSVKIFYNMNVEKKWTFLNHLPLCKHSLWTTTPSIVMKFFPIASQND